MYANSRTRRKWNQVLLFLVSCHFVKYSISSPILSSQFSQFQSARNLRNLPCVVRKSGLKGVCMFAIDCIKSNGTHLGTCIDKFYFGSCCQIKDVDSLYNIDLDDNRIDTSFPSPSSQAASSMNNKNSNSEKPYTRPVPTTTHTPSTSHFSSSNYKTSSKPVINYNNKTFELIPTTTSASSSSTTLSKRPITTKKSTTEKYAVNVGGFSTTLGNIIERNVTNTIKLRDETMPSTTESIKLTTFQSIQESIKNVTKSTTMKVSSKTKPTVASTIVTKKPVLNRTSDSTSSTTTSVRPTRRPTGSSKPSKNSTTVIKLPPTTTRKPVVTTVAVNRRTTLTSRRNSTTTRKPPPRTTQPASQNPSDGQLLTTISYVETTKAPRPRPRPTSSIIKVEPTTIYDDDTFTTTFSVSSIGDDKKSTTSKPAAANISTVKSTPVTRRPASKPTTSSITSTTGKRPITDSQTSMTATASSIIATNASTATSTMKIEVTQKPLNMTTERIVEEIHQTTPSSTVIQQSSTLSNAGLITWTLGNEVTDNATKDDAWILLTSVAPNESSNSPSIIDTMTENRIIESSTQALINDNLTQPVTIASELHKLEEVTIEIGSEENLISISPEENSSETSTEASEEDNEEDEEEEETTLETKPIDTGDEDDEETTVEFEPITTSTTTRSASTTISSSTPLYNDTQLSLNETQPVSIPDETTVNPEQYNATYDATTLSSTETDSDESVNANETTTSAPFTTTSMNLEGIDYKQICGRRMFPEARIVGGAKASFGRWPWQISLRQWRTSTYLHKCGSALLNENWAISAAHCVENVPPSDLLLRLGEYDLSIEEEPYGYQERRVQIVASHPQFDPRTFEYDLALLRFYEPVIFQPNIIPVCVPEGDEDFIGRTAYVTGWGRLYEDGPLPSVLQEVSVPVIKNEICEAMYRNAGYIEHIPHIFICAGWQKGGRDSCEGDSGGPMVIQRPDKRFQLAGIISWGIGCAEPNQPGVYTRISEFRDWINQILMF